MEKTRRVIHPYGLKYKDGAWYINAYCELREELRIFRLRRISTIFLINEKFSLPSGFNIDDFGDAHDEKIGFCNVIRKGEVTGHIENGRFLASDIKLSE